MMSLFSFSSIVYSSDLAMLLIYLKQLTKIVVLNQLQLVELDCAAMATNTSL